jgi:tRNA G46 methylase TrmB
MVKIKMNCLTESDLPHTDLQEWLSTSRNRAELKIGVHVGRFLCHMASLNQDSSFIGIEVNWVNSHQAALRVLNKSLKNVRVVNIEAYRYLNKWVADCTFHAIHIYFPTPHPISIGLTDRLIRPAFIKEAYRVLKPGGTLRLVTDDKEYYDQACGCFGVDKWWAVDWQPLNLGQKPGYFVGSPCEIKYREIEQASIYALQVIRI